MILARRIGESLKIADDVTLTVLGVKGNQVRISIDAPKTIPVHRKEIYDRIRREQRTAPPTGTIEDFIGLLAGKTGAICGEPHPASWTCPHPHSQ